MGTFLHSYLCLAYMRLMMDAEIKLLDLQHNPRANAEVDFGI